MASYSPLRSSPEEERREVEGTDCPASAPAVSSCSAGRPRLASLDVFRGLTVALMIFVDDAGAILPSIVHSPWNGVRLADFVMPFFLFIVGVSLALVYKRIPHRCSATCKATLRSAKLFFIGIFLQGGFFHGINNLTFGVDIEKIRLLGILQRIAVAYFFTALCEIWFTRKYLVDMKHELLGRYYIHWVFAFFLSATYLGLLYGLYVPDWQFEVPQLESSILLSSNTSEVYKIKCSVRGDLGPACNAAGFIDRYILGIQHLYKKPVYRNLEVCMSNMVQESPPGWCYAPFDPEGILSSLMAIVTSIIGLHFGHTLILLEDHKGRINNWLLLSCSLLALALLLVFIGIPLNKSLYTISYTLLTSGSAGLVFGGIYLLVDVYGCRRPTLVLEWIGRHSLAIYVLVASNLIFIAVQGFYWSYPENNMINWITSLVHK
ncbi:unnamed protein product [Victoria cruziana]